MAFLLAVFFGFGQSPGGELQTIFNSINTLMLEKQDDVFYEKYEGFLEEARGILDKNKGEPSLQAYEQYYIQYQQRLELIRASNGDSKKGSGLKTFGRNILNASPLSGMVQEKYEDNGIGNEVHQNNLDKLQFGTYRYGGAPSFTDIGSLTEDVIYHLFLPASIINMAQKEARETNDRRWNAVTSNYIQFVVFANGKKIFDWVPVSPHGPDPDTYYTGIALTEKRRKTLLEEMVAGSNSIRFDAYLYNHTIGDDHKPKLATGSFKVHFTESELTEIKETILKRRRNVLSPVTIYNGLNQTIRVQSTNLETDAYLSEKIGPLQQIIFYYHSENGSGIRISYAGNSKLIKHIPMDQVPFDAIRVP